MLTPSLNTVMTRLLIVAAVLAALMFVAPAIFAQEASMEVEYAENGTGEVITFTSTDPEGAGIDWDVTGVDADFFSIDSRGMLMFNRSPDYETPKDGERADDSDTEFDETANSEDNLYVITVRATETSTDGADERALSTETHVTVMVTDVNEDGSVKLNRLQPEVGTSIMASLSDSDRKPGIIGAPVIADDAIIIAWQWYVSKVTNPIVDADNHWIEATGSGNATATYIPHGNCVDDKDTGNDDGCPVENPATDASATTDPGEPVDEDKMLRVVATYDDRKGTERVARAVSMYPVRAEVSSDLDRIENPENGSPGFSTARDYTRSIPESTGTGMPVGAAVEATDPDSDTLTYEIVPDERAEDLADDIDDIFLDSNFFNVNMATGQLSLKKMLSYEATDGRMYTVDDAVTAGKYTVTVRAIDPSGEFDDVEVTVTATNTNDAPKIMGSLTAAQITEGDSVPNAASELRVDEKDDDLKQYPYTGVPDMPLPAVGLPDAGQDAVTVGLGAKNVFTALDDDARGQIFWDLEGDDADDFVLTSTGMPLSTGFGGPNEPIMLRFKDSPDFENPTDSNKDSVYKVTLIADDRRGGTDSRSITIFADNVAEKGGATMSPDQPLTGNDVTAAVEDPDNGVAIVTWQWQRATSTDPAADDLEWDVIPGATTATYTPVEAEDDKTERIESDDGYYLRAIVTYTDVTSDVDDPDTVLVDERTQQDEDGDGDPEAKTASITPFGTSPGNLYRVMVTSKNAVRIDPKDPATVDAPEFSDFVLRQGGG